MIRSAWRRIAAFWGSAGFATVLLLVVGAWSVVASVIPQGSASTKEVAEWASAHAALEPIVRVVGLHQAFANPLFIAVVIALGISTAMCAWSRTKVALHRTQLLRDASVAGRDSVLERHDLEVACAASLDAPEVLSVAAETLKSIGVKTTRRDDMLVAVSARWTAWGSPIFHWALLGLLLALLVGNTLRSEGLMGVAVGQTKLDAPASYGILRTGPLHDWNRIHRSFRVDKFEPNYKTGGVDRGPTPTVSLLDGSGKVIKTQRVYPNMTLKTGSLTIYPSSYGLAALVSETNTSGALLGQGLQLVDFSAETSGGTTALGGVSILSQSGAPLYEAKITVPLRGAAAQLNQLPENPTARVLITSSDGRTVLDKIVQVGETISIPGAANVRLDEVVYYARLQVVDDWTIPLLYAGLLVALVGLSIATLARQQAVLVAAVEDPAGIKLVARVRLWRNASTSRSEIEDELSRALNGVEQGSMS